MCRNQVLDEYLLGISALVTIGQQVGADPHARREERRALCGTCKHGALCHANCGCRYALAPSAAAGAHSAICGLRFEPALLRRVPPELRGGPTRDCACVASLHHLSLPARPCSRRSS
eukprot:Tamp_19544.p3 GENE.Tamp_19544~~Tamp_19544.p3  ORF type:complete len:127 (+),score=4.81 Tamp_19544:32-382(+)